MSDTINHNPMTDLVQSTGTLLKSVGRFSLGMSLQSTILRPIRSPFSEKRGP